jgi:hypothetical protein
MVGVVVLLIVAGCAVYQYFKGTAVKAFATIIIAVCASVVSFGYYEFLANTLTKYSASLANWAQPLCHVLLFVLTFAILQTIVTQLIRHPVDLGLLPERIGRVVCGIFLGIIVSGVLLTAFAMAPLPNKYPYQRFDQRNPDPHKPNTVLLNADGFVTGWFTLMSNGSFSAISNRRSFAALHPAFLDQVFLNRHKVKDGVSILTNSDAIEVPRKDGAWYAPDNIKDTDGRPISAKTGHNLVIVRIGIKKAAQKDAGIFTLSQVRLICKPRSHAKNPLVGKSRNVYPIGYMQADDRLQRKNLSEIVKLQRSAFTGNVKYIDFGFFVPNNFIPVLLEFKLNNVVLVPAPVSAEQAPEVIPFDAKPSEDQKPAEKPGQTSTDVTPPPSEPESEGSESRSERRGQLSDISRSIVGDQLDEQ